MDEVITRPTGLVVAFPHHAVRPRRSLPAGGGPLGEIVLFTGIRYERVSVQPDNPRPVVSGGVGRRRRP
ncbi:MAG: hypothetical protein ABW026_18420 [Microvirga sp.]